MVFGFVLNHPSRNPKYL
ncbi:hypothetical protein KVL31_03920 [Helicobacter pylori]|nr:hypothetical protein KVL31_03920 [Helicobacter pylori]